MTKTLKDLVQYGKRHYAIAKTYNEKLRLFVKLTFVSRYFVFLTGSNRRNCRK